MRKGQKEQHRNVSVGREIHFTIRASEATIERIYALLLLAEIPESKEPKDRTVALPLPWETPEETAEFGVLPPTREELQEKAVKLTQQIGDTFAPGLENVKALLASFGVPRITKLSDAQLPVFVQALETMPIDPAQLPAFIEALHASEADKLV